MRNREAARYARAAAMTAGLLALIVAGVYVERAIREARARQAAPPAVPQTVQQRSAEFSFSKVEQDRTLFTVRASRATEFKDQNRSVLEDVWISIYGRDGNRNDNIHTHECSYEPKMGSVRCQGEVQIDMESANPGSGKPADKPLEVKTRDLSFSRETGEASTAEAVEFHFSGGEGRAVGADYNTSESTVRLEHSVELQLVASPRTENLPVSLSASSAEIRRNDRTVVLFGPIVVKQGSRELSAEKISIELDPEFHAHRAVAQGHPAIRAAVSGGEFQVSADQLEGDLSPAGWMERIVADGHVAGARRSPGEADNFSTGHAEFVMRPQENAVLEMTASGGVTVISSQAGNSRKLTTDALRVEFAHGRRGGPQRIAGAETLAPATIEMTNAGETTELHAAKYVAQFGSDGRLQKLLGHGGIEIQRRAGSGPAQSSSARELGATFRADGEWSTLEETGTVRFQQGDRQASADKSRIVHSTDTITLDGGPVISDPASRTTAASVSFNQASAEFRATGGVVSTYFGPPQGESVDLGSGPAHVSAESLSGSSSSSGQVIYEGHARLWQGAAVLDADRIELWRAEKKLEAIGGVVAVFPQTTGPFGKSVGPTLWEVRAPTLIYWSEEGRARLEGGATASSEQGSLESRTLDVFLAPPAAAPAGKASAETNAGAVGGRQVSRVLARGGVVVRQGDRRGTAEQGEYTAADGKFVLSGGAPTLTDASRDTTTGRSLTFYVANDTILIDSQEGSRTLTKHRVEK